MYFYAVIRVNNNHGTVYCLIAIIGIIPDKLYKLLQVHSFFLIFYVLTTEAILGHEKKKLNCYNNLLNCYNNLVYC